MHYYTVHHLTNFTYSEAISESVMEVRMKPLDDSYQTTLNFNLRLSPRAKVLHYKDYLKNTVHHFGIPSSHLRLSIAAESSIAMQDHPEIPYHLPDSTWETLEAARQNDLDLFDFFQESHFARPSAPLLALRDEFKLDRHSDPLSTLRRLNDLMYTAFDYAPASTQVDSPIEDALESRRGVCQDYVHIMITLVRGLGIPARYVSGYLFHRARQDRSAADATHAWLEAWLPPLGWVGFDPTNKLMCNDRHIRTAVGRDYADVPPTRGVFRGDASTQLEVAVVVRESKTALSQTQMMSSLVLPENTYERPGQQQQQQ
jgi:transglutaminase-like putative cysteine protease